MGRPDRLRDARASAKGIDPAKHRVRLRKRLLPPLAVALWLVFPLELRSGPDGVVGVSADASAAQGSGTVAIDLALLAQDGAAVVVSWVRTSGSVEEVADSVSADGQVAIDELLTRWQWEVVGANRFEATTTAAAADAITADFESGKAPPPDDYPLVFASPELTAGVPLSVGRVLVARDSPGVYSALAYLDFDAFPASPAAAGTGESGSGAQEAAGSEPLPQPEAASSGGMTSSRYVVWPEVARLGETVAVLLETQSEVDLYPDGALLEAAAESFAVVLTDLADPGAGSASVVPRAVIEAPAALGSLLIGPQSPSWAALVLVFDLPDPWTLSSLSFPADLGVQVDYQGIPVFDGKALAITDAGGAPLADGELAGLRGLELRPMLRLRPSWDPAAVPPVGFDPSWAIGALELTLRYQKPAAGDVANLAALANGDATGALASAVELAAPAGEKAWQITLVAPEGFAIPDKGCVAPGDCYAGRWSLLDLPLDKLPEALPEGAPIFGAGDFAIEDLRVLGLDGAELASGAMGEDFFRIHAVDNLVDPPAPPGGSGIRVWPTQAYTGDTLAVLFNSEADVDAQPDAALLDAAVDNVMVTLEDPLGHAESVPPYAVVELPAAQGSEAVGSSPASQTGVVAFVRIPDPWPNPSLAYDPPPSFAVSIDYDGALSFDGGSVTILGTQGALTDFTPVVPLGQLAAGPMLRLRPRWDGATGEGFDPSWEVGGLELALRYTPSGTGEVTDLAPVANGEAAASLAIAGRLPDQGADRLWRLSLVEPDGLAIPDKGCVAPGDCYAGRWSLLDLRLTTQANGLPPGAPHFDANEFAVEAVQVFDRDGAPLNAPSPGEPFFQKVAVNVPEPGGTPLLLAGVLGLWGLGRIRQRRQSRGRAGR